jgi:hypothetical protein
LPQGAATRASQQQIIASRLNPQATGSQAFFGPLPRLQTDLQAGFALANQKGSTQVQNKTSAACWGRTATHSHQPCSWENQLQLGPCECDANPSRLQERGRIDPHLISQGQLGLPWNRHGCTKPLQVETTIGTTIAAETKLALEHIKGQPDLGAPPPEPRAPDPSPPLRPAIDQDLITPELACNHPALILTARRRRPG